MLRVPDKELVATAGIDALAFIRVCQFGIQLFFPITIVSMCVFLPVHVTGTGLDQEKSDFIELGGELAALRSGLNSKMMRTTAANLTNGDPVMWLHVVVTWSIVVYATWLLRRHTRTFALLRQLYLTTAGDTNLWRAVHMPTTILQQMLVQGREVEAEMDVGKMREQVTESNAIRSSEMREGEGDGNDTNDDNEYRPMNSDENRSSGDDADELHALNDKPSTGKKTSNKKFHQDLHMKHGLGLGNTSSSQNKLDDDGFEFDVSGSMSKQSEHGAGLSRFHPGKNITPQRGDDTVLDIGLSPEEIRKECKRNKLRSPTARSSMNVSHHQGSAFAGFSDDMADVVVSAGKHGRKPLHATDTLRHRGDQQREQRVGGMSIEAMAFLATPVLQQSHKGGLTLERGDGRFNRGHLNVSDSLTLSDKEKGKITGFAGSLLPQKERVPTVFESAEEGLEPGGVSPRVGNNSLGNSQDVPSFARRSQGGMKALRNNIKGLKKQQLAKAKAAAAASAGGGGVEVLMGQGETSAPKMAGAANDAYETPGLAQRNSAVLRRISVTEMTEHLEKRRVSESAERSTPRAVVRTPEVMPARTSRDSQPEAPEISDSPSPPKTTPAKKKKLKVPKGMRIGLQAAKAKMEAKLGQEGEVTGEVRPVTGEGTVTVADAKPEPTPIPSVPTPSAPVPPSPVAKKPVAKTVPAGMRVGLLSRKTDVPAASASAKERAARAGPSNTSSGPGPVVESYDRGGFSFDDNSNGASGSGDMPTVVPASADGVTITLNPNSRLPTVYTARDGTPTVYFGPDGGEGAAAAAASSARRNAADTGYLERMRANRTGTAAPSPTPIADTRPTDVSGVPHYASPPRTRQPRRPDGLVPAPVGVPAFHLDTSSHTIQLPEKSAQDDPANDKLAKKKSKHRRTSSLPTKEYLATLGFGGVGLDEAFDLGGNRTQRLKEAEQRELERERARRETEGVGNVQGAPGNASHPGNSNPNPQNPDRITGKTPVAHRLDRILSNTGSKTPGGKNPGRHHRRGSAGTTLSGAANALSAANEFKKMGKRTTSFGDVIEGSGEPVPISDRQTGTHHASRLTGDVKGKNLLPIDDIAHGSSSPLLASDVKRVLEHVADAHRNRHRRRESTESGSVGSSPSHSRSHSFRDLSTVGDLSNAGTSGTSETNSPEKDYNENFRRQRSADHSKKPSVEDADYFDGWVDSEDDDQPDVAIDHDWWSGLNIDDESEDEFDGGDRNSKNAKDRFEAYYVHPATEDYEGSRHGARESQIRSSKIPDSTYSSYDQATAFHPPDAMDAMEKGEQLGSPTDATTASAAKGAARAARMVEMPVPDVNARRTVNTYDPESQRLVSVWAANYTVLMTDLVPVRQPDGSEKFPTEAVEAMFANLFPDEFRGIIPVFDHRPVDRLLDQRDELLNTLNKLVEKQRRSYQTTYTKRDWRVMTGVDAAKLDLEQCEKAIVLAREAILSGDPGPSCFAVFATQKAAAEAAQCLLHSGSRRNFRVQPAPGPDNVNWQTLLYRREQSLRRIVLITPLILFILLFPSGIFTVGIASACVGERPGSLDWYCSEEAEGFNIFVSGLLPPVLLTLWEVFVVSFFLMYCVQAQNVHSSCSSTDRRFLRYYFVWGFVNVLLGGITGGALTSFAQQALGQDNTTYSIQKHLGRVLPISSNFFLVFVFFRSVYLPIQRLILPHPGIICWAVRRYLCIFGCAVTHRDRTVKYSPRGIRMGREVGVFLMVCMLGLTFCLTAPMIAPACLLFFVANFVVWRYHTLYVYERGWESNGSMWFTVVELVVWCLLVAQSFTSCVLFSKQAYLEGIVLYVTVPYYLYKYIVSVKAEFGSGNSWSVPLGEAAKAPPADFSAEIYTHPSLRPAAMGWHPDVGKVWRGYPGVAVKHTV